MERMLVPLELLDHMLCNTACQAMEMFSLEIRRSRWKPSINARDDL